MAWNQSCWLEPTENHHLSLQSSGIKGSSIATPGSIAFCKSLQTLVKSGCFALLFLMLDSMSATCLPKDHIL